MDPLRPFGAIFKDQDAWWKIPLMGLIPYTLVGALFAAGWMLDYQLNVVNGRDGQLPEFSDFGERSFRGAKFLLFNILVGLPLLLTGYLLLKPFFAMFVQVIATSAAAAAPTVPGAPPVTPVVPELPSAAAVATAVLGLGVLLVVYSVYYMPALVSFNVNDEIGKGFAVGEIFRGIFENLGSYLAALGLTFAFSLGMGAVTGGFAQVATAAGPFAQLLSQAFVLAGFTVFQTLVVYHWWGQYARKVYGITGEVEEERVGWHHLMPSEEGSATPIGLGRDLLTSDEPAAPYDPGVFARPEPPSEVEEALPPRAPSDEPAESA